MRSLLYTSLYTLLLAVISDSKNIYFSAIIDIYTRSGHLSQRGLQAQAAILMALEDINNKTDGIYDDILPDCFMNVSFKFPYIENKKYIESAVALSGDGTAMTGCIGPGDTEYFSVVNPILVEGGVFHMGYRAGSVRTPEQFLRTSPANEPQAIALARLIRQHFGWERIGVITSMDSSSINSYDAFKREALNLGIQIICVSYLPSTTSKEEYEQSVTKMAKCGARILVILTAEKHMQGIATEGNSIGLFRSNLQLLTLHHSMLASVRADVGLSSKDISRLLKGAMSLRPSLDISAAPSFAFVERFLAQQSTVGVFNSTSGGYVCHPGYDASGFPLYRSYEEEYIRRSSSPCLGLNFSAFSKDGSDIEMDAFYAYDAVISLAHSIHYLMKSDNFTLPPSLNSAALLKYVTKNSFTGATGRVTYRASPIEYSERAYRLSDMPFEVVNFNSEVYLRDSSGSVSSGLVFVGNVWNNHPFESCEATSSNCYPIVFNTEDNSPPTDRPHTEFREVNQYAYVAVVIVSTLGFLCSVVCVGMLYIYRSTRLVRVAQPIPSSFVIAGCMLAFATAISIVREVTVETCCVNIWLAHVSFVFIFAPLVAKIWRIHLVLNFTDRHHQISTSHTVVFILCMISISVVILAVETKLQPQKVSYRTLSDDQFNHVKEVVCHISPYQGISIGYEAILLLYGIYLLYKTRNLPVGISDAKVIASAMSTLITCTFVAGALVLFFEGIDYTSFVVIVAVVFILATFRVMTVLFFTMGGLLLKGYDLDRKFQLTRVSDEKSVSDKLLRLVHVVVPLMRRKRFVLDGDSARVKNTVMSSSEAQILPGDELMAIQAEIDRLNERLDLLANRALYPSRANNSRQPIRSAAQYSEGDCNMENISNVELGENDDNEKLDNSGALCSTPSSKMLANMDFMTRQMNSEDICDYPDASSRVVNST